MKSLRAPSLLLALATAASLLTTPIGGGDSHAGPASCVPFGTAQLPPGAPATGSRAGLSTFPRYTGTSAPSRVEMRTETTQFNLHWEFALVGHRLITRPRSSTQWRSVPLPSCLRNRLVAISLDDDELVGVDGHGWIYTMDNVNQSPRLWNWTSAWGAMLWTGPGRTLPAKRVGGWALSVTSPSDNRAYQDIAGRVHPSGQAKMTMIPTLTGDGSRITYADPWLPNDNSYEVGGPLGGRFRSRSLSAAASTMFVMNKFGDMFTRTFDFDSSGSDSVFFRYSWESQRGKPSADNLMVETWDRSKAAVQLPAPDWTRQPKIPGEIFSTVTVIATGPGVERRELRVAGKRDGVAGFWHKSLQASNWSFTSTGGTPPGTPVENSTSDRSSDTLAPPVPWNLSASLPSRKTLVDGQLLIDIGLPYSVVDPRLLDQVGLHAPKSGYRLYVTAFDPAATTRPAVVVTPSGKRIDVLLHTADGMRMSPRTTGLTSVPRHLIGAVALDDATFARRASDPTVRAFVRDWMRGKQVTPITLSATTTSLVIR
ncbi:hypothetical protein JVX90_16955 [Gordonia sp. PDNC005]|uniref:hypothetical protein n=1 Tax=unclassified Gordonia (in: high G+C Gram-positive bacteria) TaxID=2657482 RepID=UPI001965063F|nr:hypothetical protein [Gordonia sp. PDNC005]QRY62066.1 hypothetical protein JVX90_16955 [Gordonia sp. PDNC005]